MALHARNINNGQSSSRGSEGDDGNPSPVYMEFMKSEQNRLKTYLNWSPDWSQKPEELSKSGLFYTNITDRVQCPFCYGVLKNWLPSDCPYIEHSRHFPFCRFVQGFDVGNIPLESNNSTNALPLETFQKDNFQVSEAISIAPTHAKNIVTYRGKSNQNNVDFTKETNRLKTYSSWPRNLKQTPEELAHAGFYCIPSEKKTDRVQCAYCKGILFGWLSTDDPWLEHTRCFPQCPYIKMCSEEDIRINSQQNGEAKSKSRTIQDKHRPLATHPDSSQGSKETYSIPDHEDTLKSHMKSASVEAILEMGYSEDLVLRIVKKCLKERPRNFPPTEELASMVMELDDPQPAARPVPPTPLQRMMAAVASTKSQTSSGNKPDTSSSRNSSRDKNDPFEHKTNERFICKICMENQVRVTFMPCGHLACCGQCSLDLMECPICRSHIVERIRTYF